MMARRSKVDLIEEMKDCGWHVTVTKEDSYEDVKSAYEVFLDETSDDSLMFPNGRDYDAEDEDGPC